jgi:dynein heavy chain, axonemal
MEDEEFDFPEVDLADRGHFNYRKLWSDGLRKQVELSTHRFLKYAETDKHIKSNEVQQFKKQWMQRALELIPHDLVNQFPGVLRS